MLSKGNRIDKTKNIVKFTMKNFIEELEWRGMIHTVMPGADEELKKGKELYHGILMRNAFKIDKILFFTLL